MKTSYLTIVKKVSEQLGNMKSELEKVKDGLQEGYDNLSFEEQDSEYGEELQDALDALEAAICDGLETADDELFNVVSSLEMLPTCDRGEEEEDNWDEDLIIPATLSFGIGAKGGNREKQSSRPSYDPYDNHWESSFDWKDEDNDGYDDRDDGFWTPAE